MGTLTDNAILNVDANTTKAQKGMKGLDKSTKKARIEIEKLDDENRDLNRSLNELLVTQQKLKAENKKGSEEWKKNEAAIKATRAEITKNKDAQKALRQEIGITALSMAELSKQAKGLKSQLRNATPGTAQFEQLNAELAKTETRLKELRAQSKRAGQSVNKSFGSKTVGVISKFKFGILAAVAALAGVWRAFKDTIQTQLEFQKQMDKVKAITNATSDEIKILTKNAKDLGAATTFTASEVGQLQEEYAKLGFSTSEILKATESTLALAQAAGEDLASSAQVAGATLRGFGLDASEMSRVNDVMAKSFSSSALDLEKFSESMKFVAPIAASAGISIEETTAMLSALADAGISGSNAGTALRRILSDMSTEGKTASEAIKDLAAEGITMTDAMDEVGRTAQTALLVLAENTEKTDELAEAYNNAAGSAQEMADIMVDNLAGDLDKARSATEALQITVGEKLNETLRIAVQRFTELITVVNRFLNRNDITTQAEDFFNAIAGEDKIQKVDNVIGTLNGYTTSIDIAQRAIDRLNQAQEPNNELLKQQERIIFQNEVQMEKYIVTLQTLQDAGEDFSTLTDEQKEKLKEYGFIVKEVTTTLNENTEATTTNTQALSNRVAALEEIRKSELDAQQIFNELSESLEVDHQATLIGIRQKASDEITKLEEERLRKEEELLTARLMAEQEFAFQSSEILGNYVGTVIGINSNLELSEQEANERRKEAAKQFAKDIINGALDLLRAQVTVAITGLTIEAIASAGILAPKVLGQVAAINAAFGAAKAVVNQFAGGRYSVVGADDGKTYNAQYIGTPKTGIYSKPALFAESGREAIFPASALAKPVVFNHVQKAIAADRGRVSQYQDGNLNNVEAVGVQEVDTTRIEQKLDEVVSKINDVQYVVTLESINELQTKVDTKNRRVQIDVTN